MKEGWSIFNKQRDTIRNEASLKTSEDEQLQNKKKASAFKGAAAAIALAAMPTSDTSKPDLDTYNHRTTASRQLDEEGITAGQKEAYKPGVSEVIAASINPFGYSNGGNEIRPATVTEDIERVASDTYEAVTEGPAARAERRQKELQGAARMSAEMAQEMVESRKDAWNMYLGLPQTHNTFGVSEYKPEKGKQDIYYYKLNNFLQNFARENRYDEEYALAVLAQKADDPTEKKTARPVGTPLHLTMTDSASGVMGNFTLTKGVDERGHYISYYDRWDLEGSVEGEKGLIGKPFEIYDRIYYDPAIIEKIERQ